jgi:glutathione S-transferase
MASPADAPAPPAALTLLYFDIHGLGARIRLACAVGGVALEDRRLSRAEFAALKQADALPFGQLPLLVVARGAGGEAKKLAQSSAILRYVCTIGGLHPAGDELAAAAVDAALAAEQDAFAAVGCAKYRERNGFAALEGDALSKAEAALRNDVLPRHLSHLERALAASATGWIAGTARPSAADFAWGTQLRDLHAGQHSAFLPAEVLAPFAAARGFLERFLALPEVDAYYKAHP